MSVLEVSDSSSFDWFVRLVSLGKRFPRGSGKERGGIVLTLSQVVRVYAVYAFVVIGEATAGGGAITIYHTVFCHAGELSDVSSARKTPIDCPSGCRS